MLRDRGTRVTTARRAVLEALVGSPQHLSAEQIAAEVGAKHPDVQVSTIYRNLDELQRLGVVVHTHLGHGAATYHLAQRAHTHLVCERCQAVIDADNDLYQDLARRARRRWGFTVNASHFAILGRCAACQG